MQKEGDFQLFVSNNIKLALKSKTQQEFIFLRSIRRDKFFEFRKKRIL